jgi:hypothetical protein
MLSVLRKGEEMCAADDPERDKKPEGFVNPSEKCDGETAVQKRF